MPKTEIPSFVYDPSCVLYLPLWKRDARGGTSFISDDASGYTCAVTGATWGLQGRTFNGTSDNINCGSSSSLDITSKITVIIWAKKTSLSAQNWVLTKSLSGTSGDRCYELCVKTNGQLDWWMGGSDRNSSSFVQANTWFCAGITHDGANDVLFLNGKHDVTIADTNTITSQPTAPVRIGVRVSSNYWDGIVGDVAIFNRAYTPQEVKKHYLATQWCYR